MMQLYFNEKKVIWKLSNKEYQHIELRHTLMNLIKDSSVCLHVLKKRVKATRKTNHKIVHG